MVEISLSGSGGGHGRVASRGYPTIAFARAHVGCDQEMVDREEERDEELKLGYVVQRVKIPSVKRARAARSEPCDVSSNGRGDT